jgi:hypothetical protein
MDILRIFVSVASDLQAKPSHATNLSLSQLVAKYADDLSSALTG